jgi:hypothetical protein
MDVADARLGCDNPIGTGSLFQGCQQAWALGISLESSSDMLEEPLQFHAAARRSNGECSMATTIQDAVIESDNP